MNDVNDYLLPEGFKEFMEFMDSKNSKVFKAKDIQKGLSYQYKFSSGKISGIINRAEERSLITRIGRGVYQYNGLDGEKIKLSSSKKTLPASTYDSSLKDRINEEILQTVKRINEILAQEISNLSTEEFENVKSIINKLNELGKGK